MNKAGWPGQAEFERDLKRPKIDVHFHVGDWGLLEAHTSAAEVARDFDRYNYAFAVMNAITGITYDPAKGNARTASFLAALPRARGLVVVRPTMAEASIREMHTYAGHTGFVGLKTAACYYGTTLKHPGYEPILRLADAWGLPILTHKYDLDCVAGEYRNVTFIAAHTNVTDVRKLVRFPNVYFDFCASYTHRGETGIEGMAAIAGAERILFGSDAQALSPSWAVGKLSSAGITEADRQKIFYDNAFRLFGGFKPRTLNPQFNGEEQGHAAHRIH